MYDFNVFLQPTTDTAILVIYHLLFTAEELTDAFYI